ncbi:hypothetical protein ACLOJK_001411 [Asimina triloba]
MDHCPVGLYSGTSEPVKPIEGTGQEAKLDASNGYSPNSVFVNSEPMREEQVQNAVKFLSHPKVRGSPVMYRRSFLEKKGLTREEIDEAFRRVPDPAPNTTTPAVATSSQESKLQVSTQAPAATAPIGAVPAASTLQHPRFHWSHAVLAVGVLAASGAGTAVLFKNMFVPRLKSWIRKVVVEGGSEKKDDTKPTATEEAAAAAKVAAAAATDIARASQEMLNSKNEGRSCYSVCLPYYICDLCQSAEFTGHVSYCIKLVIAVRVTWFTLVISSGRPAKFRTLSFSGVDADFMWKNALYKAYFMHESNNVYTFSIDLCQGAH